MTAFYMDPQRDSFWRRAGSAALACGAALLISIVMTWPLAAGFDHLGRTRSDDGDGLFSIWTVTWVARALSEQPTSLFDGNIFYPHRNTLAFSELNLVAGIVGIPGWLFTRNPYVTLNSALLFAFATSALGAWLLARHLSGSRSAATAAAVIYAFCPFFFAHTPHIQLLMGGGIPLSLLMLHRLADAPGIGRGAALGGALAAQALACAYYGIFAGLMVGYTALFLGVSRSLLRNRAYWSGLGAGAALSIALVLPFFLPFLEVQEGGFHRTLDESRRYAATLADYTISPAHAHQWLRGISARFGRWHEPLFPGVIALGLGVAGLAFGLAPRNGEPGRVRGRETVALYGSLGLIAVWASLGPAAGLYTALFKLVPLFSFLRAPSRFGVVLPLVLAVLGSLALARLNARMRTAVSLAVAALAAFEVSVLPFPWYPAPPLPRPYTLLAQLPDGPVAEFPFYGSRVAFPLHTQYLVFSTFHWKPLLNGYSDHFPADFRESAVLLDSFPSNDSFAVMRRRRVRYIGVHWNMFGARAPEIRERLKPYARHLRELSSDDQMTLYEVVSFP